LCELTHSGEGVADTITIWRACIISLYSGEGGVCSIIVHTLWRGCGIYFYTLDRVGYSLTLLSGWGIYSYTLDIHVEYREMSYTLERVEYILL